MTKLNELAAYLSIAILFLLGAVAPAAAFDSHAGYYYPEPQTREAYVTEVTVDPTAEPRSRAGFVIGLAAQHSNQNHDPGYHLFAKGGELEKLIIVATGNERYDTLYRMRALLASLTSMARATELFSRTENPHELNFLDFCKLIGFKQVTISNGKDLTHQIKIQ